MIYTAEIDSVRILADACAVGASLGCFYLIVASVLVLLFSLRREVSTLKAAPVSILKPLCGKEPELERRLAALRDQEYGAPIQIVCGLRDSADPALSAAQQTASDGADRRLDIHVDAREIGSNRKISNLANMLAQARHDILVISDSDIEVGPHYLAKVVALLQNSGVGGVTCLFHGSAAANHWSRQAALAINIQFLPNAVAAIMLGLAQPCFGSTIALRRATLARLRGFQSFADCLADDYAIGAAIRASGETMAIPTFSVGHACFEDSLRTLLKHEIRTARTIKSINPLGYCGTIFSHPFPLALCAGLCGHRDGLLIAAIALLGRGLLCLCVEYGFGLARQPYWLIPARDMLSFGVFLASFFGGTISWRGHDYHVASGGTMVADHKVAQ